MKQLVSPFRVLIASLNTTVEVSVRYAIEIELIKLGCVEFPKAFFGCTIRILIVTKATPGALRSILEVMPLTMASTDV